MGIFNLFKKDGKNSEEKEDLRERKIFEGEEPTKKTTIEKENFLEKELLRKNSPPVKPRTIVKVHKVFLREKTWNEGWEQMIENLEEVPTQNSDSTIHRTVYIR